MIGNIIVFDSKNTFCSKSISNLSWEIETRDVEFSDNTTKLQDNWKKSQFKDPKEKGKKNGQQI